MTDLNCRFFERVVSSFNAFTHLRFNMKEIIRNSYDINYKTHAKFKAITSLKGDSMLKTIVKLIESYVKKYEYVLEKAKK